MTWIYFALVAPIFWSISNFVDKYTLEKYFNNVYDFLFFSTLTSWIFVPILILIFGIPEISIYSVPPIIFGIVLIGSYGFYGKALALGETSRIVLMFKLIPVLTLILGYILLHQTLTLNEFIAFVLVLIGAFFVSLERIDGKLRLFKGVRWILIDIIIWSILFVCIDWSLTTISFESYIVWETLGTALAGPLMFLIPNIRRQIIYDLQIFSWPKFNWMAVNNVFDLLGQMSVKKALALAPSAGLVTVAIQIQSLYIIILGVILTILFPTYIKEDISRKNLTNKFVGAFIMFAGVYILFTTT
ncbi:hypothetical protein CL653_02425 [bacterium]|nr:hypothetical protein [bacterium]|tara:strand:+ start:480 stop:1382 length:903 start_codon:yes stop_codon:yes gene_type:complete